MGKFIFTLNFDTHTNFINFKKHINIFFVIVKFNKAEVFNTHILCSLTICYIYILYNGTFYKDKKIIFKVEIGYIAGISIAFYFLQ